MLKIAVESTSTKEKRRPELCSSVVKENSKGVKTDVAHVITVMTVLHIVHPREYGLRRLEPVMVMCLGVAAAAFTSVW
jgi:hypothetical protein